MAALGGLLFDHSKLKNEKPEDNRGVSKMSHDVGFDASTAENKKSGSLKTAAPFSCVFSRATGTRTPNSGARNRCVANYTIALCCLERAKYTLTFTGCQAISFKNCDFFFFFH